MIGEVVVNADVAVCSFVKAADCAPDGFEGLFVDAVETFGFEFYQGVVEGDADAGNGRW